MWDSRDMWCRLQNTPSHVITQTNTLHQWRQTSHESGRRKPFRAERQTPSFVCFNSLVNPITEHSAHDLCAHKPISLRKNCGVKRVNSQVDLYCKWMGHFQKTRQEAPGRLPSLSRGEVVHQGSLFNYELSSRGRKRKTIQFKADWLSLSLGSSTCMHVGVCVCVRVCACAREWDSIDNQ